MGASVRSNPSAFARKWFLHGARKVSFTNSQKKPTVVAWSSSAREWKVSF